MKIKFLFLNIFFATAYSILAILNAPSITIGFIIKTTMLSLAVIFVGYILDAKSPTKETNTN
ncbi:MAG: hypothetical protein RSA01_04980 [Clostridium sp.]